MDRPGDEDDFQMTMRASLLIAGAVIAAFALGPEARADVAPPTAAFQFSGGGFSGSGTFTISTDTVSGDPSNAYAITGVSGTFSDANLGLSNQSFNGVVPINPIVPTPSGVLGVASFSRHAAATPAGFVSYDNLLYSGAGSPIVCDGYPFSDGFLDVYGALLTLQNGDTVALWSNGDPSGSDNFYGIYLLSSSGAVLDNSPLDPGGDPSGITANVPEPGSLPLLATALLVGAVAWLKRPGASDEDRTA